MVSRKPRIVIIGAGMAGLTAANKLHTHPASEHLFDLTIVEGSARIGGRISTAEFSGDRIEQGATWIHGIDNSPVYKIARESNSLSSDEPYECMDGGAIEGPITVAEGGYELPPSIVEPISRLFKNLMDFVQGKSVGGEGERFCSEILRRLGPVKGKSVGAVLRKGLEMYWEGVESHKYDVIAGNWSKKELEDRVFAMLESVQRTFTSSDLFDLDYDAEKDYVMFPGEEITIAKGYSSVVQSLASVLPQGMIQFNRRVEKIEWKKTKIKKKHSSEENGCNDEEDDRPVKLHFEDGAVSMADHVILTVSLGVLKRGISKEEALFDPPLPSSKSQAISQLGYGVVDKVFLQLSPSVQELPFLQMVFHGQESDLKNPKIPNWIRRTSFLTPIYGGSRVVLSWFTGQEALELESMSEEEIAKGFSSTLSNLLPQKFSGDGAPENGSAVDRRFERVLRTQWGTNPLFLGSYSYVAVGSTIDDMDVLAEPLPEFKKGKNPNGGGLDSAPPPLQILFAGEATHKTHYSTTHGAYFSGLREADRLIKHYIDCLHCNDCCNNGVLINVSE